MTGELFITWYWLCRIRSTRTSWEGIPSSSTACWSLHKVWAKSRDKPHFQSTRKASSSGAVSYFLGSHYFATYWIHNWGESCVTVCFCIFIEPKSFWIPILFLAVADICNILWYFTAITIRGEPEELPYFSCTCHICCHFPFRNCSSSVALCAFLVEG